MVLLTIGVTLADPGDELAACRSTLNGKPQVTINSDRWVRIGVPKFDSDEGPATIASFSAMPTASNGLMVTNGTVVKLSVDAGCTWNTVFRSNGIQAPAPGYTPDVITQVVEPSDSTAWLTAYDDINGVRHPHVYVGSGVGASGQPSFGQDDVGLPSYGTPVSLVVPFPGLGEAYLLVDELPDPQSGAAAVASRHLYSTHPANPPQSGAVSAQPWGELGLPSGFGRVDGLTRESANKIWIWSGRQYAWAVVDPSSSAPEWHTATAAGPISTIDVETSGAVDVIEQTAKGAVLAQPTQQGGLVPRLTLPITSPYAFTHGTYQNVYVTSGADGTWGYDHLLHRWIDITPHGGPAFHVLTMAQATSSRIVLGMSADALWRWDTFDQQTFVPPPPPPPATGGPPKLPHSNLKKPILTPKKTVVTLAPGAVGKVPVTLQVPPEPTPLDVYFLVDTTASMSPAILGLQRSILGLSRHIRSQLGVNACFGVGGVKDTTNPTSSTNTTDPSSTYVFKTFLPVAPCDTSPKLDKVRSATEQLKEGGGGDPPEAQTLGLSLAVNGQSSISNFVPLPQPANFRPGAFKVIVYISDQPSHQGGGIPTIPDVIQTLNTNDVKIVSIAVDHVGGDLNGATSNMNQLATGTGSMAPPSGVDCNGNGIRDYGDLGPGAPLVCQQTVTSASDGTQMVPMESAVFGLLLAVKDPGTIEVKIKDPNHALKGPIQGLTKDVADMKYQSGLKFTLPVGCAPDQFGKTLHIHLSAFVRSKPVDSPGEVDVVCKAHPKLPPVPIVPAAAPFVFLPAARPPVAVAPPIPPNPPAQPATNVNPNAGMAREQQQQAQLAMAGQDAAEPEGEDTEVVEMSAMRNPAPRNDAMFLAGAAVLMSAAAGCAMQLRRREAFVRQGR